MTIDTCTEHDDTVVVYDSYGNNRRPCPLCQAIADAQMKENELNQQIEDIQGKLDSTLSDFDDAQIDLATANSLIENLEDNIKDLEAEAKE
jgi:chromosome segregation ATPase